ncbi:MAG TPA: response regulator [Polyangiaceae bacterium]|nr:response regulator [Polyangiaceae bacterium]
MSSPNKTSGRIDELPQKAGTSLPASSGLRRRRAVGQRPRILIVEDNPVDAARVEEKLLEPPAEYDVSTAASVAEALARLESEGFDVVLLDLHLPDGEELEALAAIRAAALGAPVLVLTGQDDEPLARRCIEAGAEDFVEKGTMTGLSMRRAVGYALARHGARELAERLAHADRLAAIGRLAVSVAHEINNPVTFITMNQELLLRRLESLRAATDDPDPRAALGAIRALAGEMHEMLLENTLGMERIAAIVRDLRTLARQEPEDVKPVDPVAVCKAACAVVQNHVRHRARLETRFESVSKVNADARKLEQVVINLVTNAAQSIPEGAVEENRVTVSTEERAGAVVIAVADTGAGMPPRVRARIFEPFYSTKVAGEGTGLGLSVSNEIILGFGGTIEVESEVGKGSRFEVVLPRAEERWHRPTPVPSTRPPVHRPKRRVLLVDDDPQVLTALERSLAVAHDVTKALGGRAALAVLEKDANFDAIVCDLTMPDVDGVAVHQALGERHPELVGRLVVVTGGAITDRTTNFLDTSGVLVLQKPVTPAALLATIDSLSRSGQ